jgi:hypothetical protein
MEQVGYSTRLDLELDEDIPFIYGTIEGKDRKILLDTTEDVAIRTKGLDVSSVRLNNWTFFNQKPLLLDEDAPYEAIMGLPFFRIYQVLIDCPQRALYLAVSPEILLSRGYQIHKWVETYYKFGDRWRRIPVELNGRRCLAILDTTCKSIVVRTDEEVGELVVSGQHLGLYELVSDSQAIPVGVDVILGAPLFLRRPVLFDLAENRVLFGKELVE